MNIFRLFQKELSFVLDWIWIFSFLKFQIIFLLYWVILIYIITYIFFIRRMNYSDAIKYLKEHDIKKEDGTYYEFGEVCNFSRLLSKNIDMLICWYVNSSEDPPHRVSKFFFNVDTALNSQRCLIIESFNLG